MSKPIVVVFGATGKQGASAVNNLLQTGSYKVRAVSRDPSSAGAQELEKRGVEIVKGSHNSDVAELDTAMKGAFAVFLMTIPGFPIAKGAEIDGGKRVVDATKKAGVQHFIFSTLPNVEKVTKGKYFCSVFTEKALIEDYARASGIPNVYAIMPAGFMQNFQGFWKPKKDEGSNSISLTFPYNTTSLQYWVDIDDIGQLVVAFLKNPTKYANKPTPYPLYGDACSCEEMCKILSEETGVKVNAQYVPADFFEKIGGKDFADAFRFANEENYYGQPPTSEQQNAVIRPTTVREWAKKSNFAEIAKATLTETAPAAQH